MSINLKKGGTINLSKEAPGVTKFSLAIGWDENKGQSEHDFDPDVTVFVCDENARCLSERDMVFYNDPTDSTGAILHSGDDRTGAGDGDNETIHIDAAKLGDNAKIIKGVITIDEAVARNQNFVMMENAFARLYETESGKEVCRYNLTEDGGTSIAMHFLNITVNPDKTLNFDVIGEKSEKTLADFCREVGLVVAG